MGASEKTHRDDRGGHDVGLEPERDRRRRRERFAAASRGAGDVGVARHPEAFSFGAFVVAFAFAFRVVHVHAIDVPAQGQDERRRAMDLRDERDAVVEDAPLAARDAVSRARQLAERLGDDSGFVRSVSVE
jgi:hypothetical protein